MRCLERCLGEAAGMVGGLTPDEGRRAFRKLDNEKNLRDFEYGHVIKLYGRLKVGYSSPSSCKVNSSRFFAVTLVFLLQKISYFRGSYPQRKYTIFLSTKSC